MAEDGINWELIDTRLAVADGPEAKERRDHLFVQLDINRNASLSLTECQAGLTSLLQGEHAYRKTGQVAEGLIPGITDFKPAITAAFKNARHLGNSSSADGANVDRSEFHALLVYFRHYLEFLAIFKKLDKAGDMTLTEEEIMPALPRLQKWDIDASQVKNKLKHEPGGHMTFDHFAEWCLSKLSGFTFDDMEGADSPSSTPSPSTSPSTGKQKIDWDAVDEKIPTEAGEEAREERDALFKKMDVTGSGHLTLTAVQGSMTYLLEGNHTLRKKGEAAHSLLPGIRDTRPAVRAAFVAARDLSAPAGGKKGKRRGHEHDTVERSEFHALLFYLRHYLELQVLFQDLDESEDNRVSKAECYRALSLLMEWGVTKKEIDNKFSEAKGELRFSQFADWCLRIKLNGETFDIFDDEDNADEEPVSEVVAEPAIEKDVGSSAAEPDDNDVQCSPCGPEITIDTEPSPKAEINMNDAGGSPKYDDVENDFPTSPIVEDPLPNSPDSNRQASPSEPSARLMSRGSMRTPGTPARVTMDDSLELDIALDDIAELAVHAATEAEIKGVQDEEESVPPTRGSTANRGTTPKEAARQTPTRGSTPKQQASFLTSVSQESRGLLEAERTLRSSATTEHAVDKSMPVKSMTRSCGSLPLGSQGVLKRPPHLKNLSHVRSMPKWKFGEKRPTSFFLTNENPAPGSYLLPRPERTGKFREHTSFSFGGGPSRFGHDPHPGKLQPAPGEYGIPRNPNYGSQKVAINKGRRGIAYLVKNPDPGPGAYEARSTLGGTMCTAKGKLPQYYQPVAALPGPGAYTPKTECLTHSRSAPHVGFGTGPARDKLSDFHNQRSPGPGAYSLDTYQQIGRDAKKCTMKSRVRCAVNFNQYVTPGPGSYDGDGTCFGY
jgi:hypothetical protein